MITTVCNTHPDTPRPGVVTEPFEDLAHARWLIAQLDRDDRDDRDLEQLRDLIRHERRELVLYSVARHPSTPPTILSMLLRSPYETVVDALLTNPNLYPEDRLDLLLRRVDRHLYRARPSTATTCATASPSDDDADPAGVSLVADALCAIYTRAHGTPVPQETRIAAQLAAVTDILERTPPGLRAVAVAEHLFGSFASTDDPVPTPTTAIIRAPGRARLIRP